MSIGPQWMALWGDLFLAERETDRIADGNDRRGGGGIGGTETATAKSAVGIPNVSRRSDARSVEIGRYSFRKWKSFRRFRPKRKISQWKRPNGKSDSEGKESNGKGIPNDKIPMEMDTKGILRRKRSQMQIDSDNDEEMEEDAAESNQKVNGERIHYSTKTTRGRIGYR